MVWISVRGPYFIVKNVLHCVILISIVLLRQLFWKLSHALWFSGSKVVMTWFVILWVNATIIKIKENPYKLRTILLPLSLCLDLILWLSVTIHHVQFVMFNNKLLCINSIGFPFWLDEIGSIITTRPNYFCLDTYVTLV